MTAPLTDGRPCTMEAYVAALRTEGLSQGVVNASIANWLKGDFEAALRPFAGNVRKRLIAEGGATEPADTFQFTEKTRQAMPVARDFIDNEAYRLANEFMEHGQSVSEATSIVANILIHAAWQIAANGRIAEGGIPDPERFRACVEAYIGPPPPSAVAKQMFDALEVAKLWMEPDWVAYPHVTKAIAAAKGGAA
ncbi:MAG: hypothetical protein ABGX47_23880 [Martelella sp.]|uniref:hypothetical protein n=1 Tax=Martelella sp. TaxID=1969699 RepID=UPI0032424356